MNETTAERLPGNADTDPLLPPERRLSAVARWLRTHPTSTLAAIVLAAVLLAAVFADLVAPYPFDAGDLNNRMAGPSTEHLLGTDKVGRDVLSRIIFGTRQSVLLAVGAVLLSQTLAVAVGLASGYFGGWFDMLAQRLIDIWIALPSLLFLIFVVGTVGGSTRVVLIALGVLLFAGSSRIVRGVTLTLKHAGFVDAARGLGGSDLRVIVRHILPNVLPLIVVQATLQMGAAVVIGSSLAFLGFGVPPPSPSWGRMLADARNDLSAPGGFNLAVWPGLAITVVAYSFAVLGDGLQDLLDPRSRRRG